MPNKSLLDIRSPPDQPRPAEPRGTADRGGSDHEEPDAGLRADLLNPNHPMRWSSGLRHWCLLQLAFSALLNGFTSAILIPGSAAIAPEFDITQQRASYLTSAHVLFLGVGPVFWTTVAERCGRRLAFVLATAISAAASLGAAYARSYGGLMAGRIVQAFAISTGNVFGASVVIELFGRENRGAKLNIWSVMVTCGPGLGALVGGFLIPAKGWRWALYLNAICCAAQLVAFMDPAMVIMGMVFGITFGVVSPGLAITLPAVFIPVYQFEPETVGLVFVSYIVGGLLGGQVGGRTSDMFVNRDTRSATCRGQLHQPEYRLRVAVLGYTFVIVGVLIYGKLNGQTRW